MPWPNKTHMPCYKQSAVRVRKMYSYIDASELFDNQVEVEIHNLLFWGCLRLRSPGTVIVTFFCHLLFVLLQQSPGLFCTYIQTNMSTTPHLICSCQKNNDSHQGMSILSEVVMCGFKESFIPITLDGPACSSHSVTADYLTLAAVTLSSNQIFYSVLDLWWSGDSPTQPRIE